MSAPRRTLLLSGCMGAGKTTIGKKIAARTGLPFVDLDEAITRRAGRSISTIFADDGEAAFRALEGEELERVLESLSPLVVALGGGALLDRGRRLRALERACVVTLRAPPEVLASRTRGRGRPILDRAQDRVATLRSLLVARSDVYDEAHAVLDVDALTPDGVADRVMEVWSREDIVVPLAARSYAVATTSGSLLRLGERLLAMQPSSVFVVTDATVHGLWSELLTAGLAPVRVTHTVVLSPGEAHKTLGSVELALTEIVRAGADRDAVIVGHGGGVVTDIAGFVAATLLRGVRWVAAPTTLLAMVDASVGGKTGVDIGPAKNAAGAFHQPHGVVIDVTQVTTETERAYLAGLTEVVKSACVGDPSLFADLENQIAEIRGRSEAAVITLVRKSIAVKASIVARDERETGDRALLNLGHTVGHALEAEGSYDRLVHGEAVALGLVAALRVGVNLGVTPRPLARRIVNLLNALGLPTNLDDQPLAEALPLVGLDKKRKAGRVRFILLRELGDAVQRPLETGDLPNLLRAID